MSAPESSLRHASTNGRRWALALAIGVHLLAGGWLAYSKPVGNYFYDERFTLENVRRVALQGHPVPTSYFWYAPLAWAPQAATLLAVDRLSDAIGSDRLATLTPEGEPTTLGIRLARSFGLLFGALTLVALHAVCRRLWDAGAADLAVVVLASSPWFARGNAELKPDALLVLLTLAAFVPLLESLAGGAPRPRRLAAVAAGAAAATKLNGALSAVPLGLAALATGTPRQRLRALGETAALFAVTFLLLNPWPKTALYYLRRVDRQWTERSQDLDFAAMLWTMTAKLARTVFLGPLFAVAAMAGLALVAVVLARRSDAPRARRLGLALWVVYPLAALVAISFSTRYPKDNLLLPVLPFAAAFAGAGLAALGSLARRRQPALAATLLPAVALFGIVTIARYVAGEVIEPAADRQQREIVIELGDAHARVLAWEAGDDARRELTASPWAGPPPLVLPLDAALATDAERLARLDCVGGAGPLAESLETRLAARFPLRRFEAPGTVALIHPTPPLWHGCRPWRRAGESARLAFRVGSGGEFEAALPASTSPFDALTLNGRARLEALPLEVRLDGRPIELHVAGIARRRWAVLATERTTSLRPGATLSVRPARGPAPELAVVYWLAPESPQAGATEAPSPSATQPLEVRVQP